MSDVSITPDPQVNVTVTPPPPVNLSVTQEAPVVLEVLQSETINIEVDTPGLQGPKGPKGSLLLNGTSDPDAGTGIISDWYLNNVTYDLYEKTADAVWTLRGNIKGATGNTGDTGLTGPANQLTLGTVEASAPGSTPVVLIEGEPPTQTISFTLPRGDVGPVGPAPNITGVTVSTGDAGTDATASIDGTSPDYSLSFSIPRGDKGEIGSQWYAGASPSGGNDGDFFLVASGTNIGDVYEKIAGDWTLSANIRGAAGTGNVDSINGVLPDNNGNVTLDWSNFTGIIPASALPSLATTEVYTVASEAAMLALSADRGDLAIRTDTEVTYILAGNDPTVLGNWTALSTNGSVVKLTGDQTIAGIKTFTSAPVVPDSSFTISKTSGLQATLDSKEGVITPGTTSQYFRGDKTWQTLDKSTIGLSNVSNAAQVDLTSDQTVGGVKTFSSAPVVPDSSFAISKTSGLQGALDGKANVVHTHDGADIVSGTIDIARIPTGTSATTVALGNHLHTGVYEPVIAAGTTSQYRRGDNTWATLDATAAGALPGVRVRSYHRMGTPTSIPPSGSITTSTGVTVVPGDLVLIGFLGGAGPKGGVYTVQSGVWTRTPGFTTSASLSSIIVSVAEGTDTSSYRIVTSPTGTIDTSTVSFIKNVETTGLIANKAVIFDVNGQFIGSTTSDVELGYVSGVTSSIQTQLNNRVDLSTAQTIGGNKSFTGTTTLGTTIAGSEPEGQFFASPSTMNDFANARLRGSTFTFTGGVTSVSNANIDTMFSGKADYWAPGALNTLGATTMEFTLPKTLFYTAFIGVNFSSSGWVAPRLKVETFTEGAWTTLYDVTNNTQERVFLFINGNAGVGTTKARITVGGSDNIRIAHVWGFDYASDMWTQLQMPRVGGSFYGPVSMNNNALTGVITPAAGTDAANKSYVDTALTTLNATNLTSGTVAQARLVQNVQRFIFSTATAARPTGSTYVEWVGPVQPNNAIDGDTWVNTA